MEPLPETHSSLSTLSSLTEPFKDQRTRPRASREAIDNIVIRFDLTNFDGLPNNPSEKERQIIQCFLESFKTEVHILLECQMTEHDIACLYKSYKTMILKALRKLETANNTLVPENSIPSSTSNTNLDDSVLDIQSSSSPPFILDSSSIDTDSFSFDSVTFSSSPASSPRSTPLSTEFYRNGLLNNQYSLQLFDPVSRSSSPTPSSETHTGTNRSRNTRRRQNISPETRELLESVFSVKRNPNARERRVLAERCRLSTVQIRIWFANKRARTREPED